MAIKQWRPPLTHKQREILAGLAERWNLRMDYRELNAGQFSPVAAAVIVVDLLADSGFVAVVEAWQADRAGVAAALVASGFIGQDSGPVASFPPGEASPG